MTKENDNNAYHVYDNVFLSACAWDKRLIIMNILLTSMTRYKDREQYRKYI